ncbi:MAG: hypothetical protein WKI04_05705, partial [Ferruginibacter sp.]
MKKLYTLIPGSFCFESTNLFRSLIVKRTISFKKFLAFLFSLALLTGSYTLYADVTLTTSPVPAANLNQGTNNNIVYIAQMSVTTPAVTVNNIQFTLGGTHDANDLETVLVYFNGASAVFPGSTFIGSAVATFVAPHTYSITISRP